MSENPLLPHRKLRELYALMQRCSELERKQKSRSILREALLAATSIHLLPGDLLSGSPDDLTAIQLAPEPKKAGTLSLVAPSTLEERLPLCAAAARGLQASGGDGVVLAFTRAGDAEPGWHKALEWAQSSQLPLLLVCADATQGARPRSSKKSATLDFATMMRLAKRIKLPVLTVDGEDAVAVYRVMQESLIRARFGGGPAVLWCVMSPPATTSSTLSRSKRPTARLERYLSARNIPLDH